MKVHISVTADDIAEGDREKGDSCPIALAARRVLPGLPGLFVGTMHFYLAGEPRPEDTETRPSVRLPEDAREFIAAFDECCPQGDYCADDECSLAHEAGPFDPFEFDLELPDELVQAVTP